jgi:AbrB family looped-hinge helix DNA binding protein
MVTATVTTKGQITIPKAVRGALHFQPGDRIAFVIHGDSKAAIKPITKSVDEVFGKLHSPSQACRTVEEMNAALPLCEEL